MPIMDTGVDPTILGWCPLNSGQFKPLLPPRQSREVSCNSLDSGNAVGLARRVSNGISFRGCPRGPIDPGLRGVSERCIRFALGHSASGFDRPGGTAAAILQ